MSAQIIAFPTKQPQARSLEDVADEFAARAKLRRAISDCGRNCLRRDNRLPLFVANYLRVQYSVRGTDEIPVDKLQEALGIVAQLDNACRQFDDVSAQAERWFLEEVLSAGEPWTQAIKAKLTRRYREKLPERPDWRALAQRFPIETKRKITFEE